jgi:hypothetical protein
LRARTPRVLEREPVTGTRDSLVVLFVVEISRCVVVFIIISLLTVLEFRLEEIELSSGPTTCAFGETHGRVPSFLDPAPVLEGDALSLLVVW